LVFFFLNEEGDIKKRGFAPLRHPLIKDLHDMALEADNRLTRHLDSQ